MGGKNWTIYEISKFKWAYNQYYKHWNAKQLVDLLVYDPRQILKNSKLQGIINRNSTNKKTLTKVAFKLGHGQKETFQNVSTKDPSYANTIPILYGILVES